MVQWVIACCLWSKAEFQQGGCRAAGWLLGVAQHNYNLLSHMTWTFCICQIFQIYGTLQICVVVKVLLFCSCHKTTNFVLTASHNQSPQTTNFNCTPQTEPPPTFSSETMTSSSSILAVCLAVLLAAVAPTMASFSCSRESHKLGYRCSRFQVTNYMTTAMTVADAHLGEGEWYQQPATIAPGATGAWESNSHCPLPTCFHGTSRYSVCCSPLLPLQTTVHKTR